MWDSFLYACEHVLLPLVNKAVALVYGRIELGGETKLNARREKAESKRHHVVAEGERHWEAPASQ